MPAEEVCFIKGNQMLTKNMILYKSLIRESEYLRKYEKYKKAISKITPII